LNDKAAPKEQTAGDCRIEANLYVVQDRYAVAQQGCSFNSSFLLRILLTFNHFRLQLIGYVDSYIAFSMIIEILVSRLSSAFYRNPAACFYSILSLSLALA
jgi:hypothetical protein